MLDIAGLTPEEFGVEYANAQTRIVEEFAQAVRTGVPHPLDARRGLYLQRLIARRRRTSAERPPVEDPAAVARAAGAVSSRAMTYIADPSRYDSMEYRRCGRSGLLLPAISLGLWHNFGDDRPWTTQRDICRRAFDLGVTHFDLANNYGPPYGAAESNVGRILATDFASHRDELVISTKAGYDMWPGPYGNFGSRKYLLASLDQSLQRMGLDYVDISTRTASTPTRRWRRPSARSSRPCSRARRSTVGISSYNSAAPAKPLASSASSTYPS